MSKLLQAISDIQQPDFVKLPKAGEGQVGSRKYKYLTIDKLHEVVFPLLKERGLVWVTAPVIDGGVPALRYTLSTIDGEDDDISGVMPLCLAQQDPQGLGSAITYARRYALLSLLGLIGDDDDDGAAASVQENPEASQRPSIPSIPLDRAKKILDQAQAAGLAKGTELEPALQAKLTEVGVVTKKLGHLNVDQAEIVEAFISKEQTS